MPCFLTSKECTEKRDTYTNTKNLEELECLQTEYDSIYDYITQDAIIRSRATWYEFGERNNKYFLNLEISNKKKSTVRKVFRREGKLTTDPKQIMNELEAFYSDLYDGSTCADMGSFSSFLSDLNEIPSLVEEEKNVCEGKLGYVYFLSFRTLEIKLREFQFKILNRIVFTNEKLLRFDMAESEKILLSSKYRLVLAKRQQYYCREFKRRGYNLRQI